MSDFFEYVRIVANNWLFWFGGVALVLIEVLKHTPYKETLKLQHRKWFWAPAILCIFWATYDAWHEQHHRALAEGTYVVGEPQFLYDDPFPVGLNASLNVRWRNTGAFPARDVFAAGEMYVRDAHDEQTQQEILRTFKDKFQAHLSQVNTHEHPVLQPNSPVSLWGTYKGPVLTSDDVAQIKLVKRFLFLVAAVRFTDGAGTHETHVCHWIQTPQTVKVQGRPDITYQSTFHPCDDYVTQTDVN